MTREKKTIIFNYLILSLLVLIFFTLFYSLIRNFLFYYNWKNKNERLDNSMAEIKNKIQLEEEKKKKILNDKGLEKELMKKFKLQKKGERVIKIIE